MPQVGVAAWGDRPQLAARQRRISGEVTRSKLSSSEVPTSMTVGSALSSARSSAGDEVVGRLDPDALAAERPGDRGVVGGREGARDGAVALAVQHPAERLVVHHDDGDRQPLLPRRHQAVHADGEAAVAAHRHRGAARVGAHRGEGTGDGVPHGADAGRLDERAGARVWK